MSLAAETGRLRESGNLLFHVSLVGVLLALATGSLYAYRGEALVVEGESLDVDVAAEVDADAGGLSAGPPSSLEVTIQTEKGKVVGRSVVVLGEDGSGRASFVDLPPGTHTVTISGSSPAAGVRTVTSSAVVWPSPA